MVDSGSSADGFRNGKRNPPPSLCRDDLRARKQGEVQHLALLQKRKYPRSGSGLTSPPFLRRVEIMSCNYIVTFHLCTRSSATVAIFIEIRALIQRDPNKAARPEQGRSRDIDKFGSRLIPESSKLPKGYKWLERGRTWRCPYLRVSRVPFSRAGKLRYSRALDNTH